MNDIKEPKQLESIYDAGFDVTLNREDLINESKGISRYEFADNEDDAFTRIDDQKLQTLKFGTTIMNSPDTSVTVTHNLGFMPAFLAFFLEGTLSNQYEVIPKHDLNFGGGYNGFKGVDANVTDTTITFEIYRDFTGELLLPISYPVKIKYYLFKQKLT